MSSPTTPINPKITKAAEELWDYMKMNHVLKPVDIIFVLGSRDDRIANYAAELYS